MAAAQAEDLTKDDNQLEAEAHVFLREIIGIPDDKRIPW